MGVHSNRILRPGDVVEVLRGPFCAFDPYNWYEVQFNSLTGWVTEGTGSTYWLRPFPAAS
ncbi:MAG: hypothetical protein ACOCXZ_01320 [Chloroflexota bacterium]